MTSQTPFRVVIVGLGVQGRKRRSIAGNDVIAVVDPVVPEADATDIRALDPASYDAVLLCVPDAVKLDLMHHLAAHGKHMLVEKPLLAAPDEIDALMKVAERTGSVCYTAYNHRFEPHIERLRTDLQAGALGRIYRVRLFYGNGTARDVRESAWRDQGAGVLPDLASHMLDMLMFWFGQLPEGLSVWSAKRFENRSFDHVLIGASGTMLVEMEMSLLSWRNHFVAEVVGERGSVHIASLCKWGPSTYTKYARILPSGRPTEESVTLVQPDPTWEREYAYFRNLCAGHGRGNLDKDRILGEALTTLSRAALSGWTS